MKKWYTVTLEAKMTKEDIRAMHKYFYETMGRDIEIEECADLDIKESDYKDGKEE